MNVCMYILYIIHDNIIDIHVILVDEVLQVFYDKVAKKWAVTDGIEETFCAFLFALKVYIYTYILYIQIYYI